MVIDEWLWADLAGENTKVKRREAFQFIEAIYNKCDRVVTVKGSRFDQKSMGLFKHPDVIGLLILKLFKGQFWYNSNKVVILDEDDLPELPEQLATEVKDDDHYLVRAYLTGQVSEIVTSDGPLMKVLTRHNIPCKHREEFVPAYISEYGKK